MSLEPGPLRLFESFIKGTKRFVRRVPTGLNRVLYVLYHGLFAITCIALAYKGNGSQEASQLLIFYE